MADLSKYSDEELDRMEAQLSKPGILKSLGQGYLNYAKGALRGTAQGLGDIGASVANAPIGLAEYFTGSKIPHVPHPDLLNKNPSSLSESIGQNLGEITAGFDVPGGLALKSANIANKGYKALRAGQELPTVGKIIAATLGGAGEGALGNEENRGLGAVTGGLIGGGAQGLSSGIRLARNIKSKNIAKDVENEVNRMSQDFNNRFTSHLNEGEEAGANQFLKPEKKAKLDVLKKAKQGKLLYGLEKYNENPTLNNAHNAQSDLNKISNKFANAKEGTLEHDAYKESLKLKNRLLQKISDAFEKSGSKEHGAGYQQARVDYAKEAGPYLNSPTVKGYLGKNKRGTRTIRPSQFADKLLQEEDFLARAGHKHPGLLQREIAKHIAKHPVTKLAAVAGASYLPYEVQKLLGH